MGRWGTNLDTDLEGGVIRLHWRCVTSCRTGCVDFKINCLAEAKRVVGRPRLKLFFSTSHSVRQII
jgi:hypothetical protein